MTPRRGTIRAGFHRGLRREEGTALLEMMVSLLTVVSLAFGLFELCLFTYTAVVLNYAAQQGVRYAIMHGTDSAQCSGPDSGCTDSSYSKVKAAVTSAASTTLHNISAMTVSVSYPNSTATPGSPVTIVLSYSYVPYVGLLHLEKTMTFSAEGKILF